MLTIHSIILSESDQRLGVHSFNDPVVALQEFEPGLYDLIIIDILMPSMNGFEFYDKVRELDSNVKICVLTTASKYISYTFQRILLSNPCGRGFDGIEKVSIIDIFWGLLFGLVGSG
jgi:two-component SAPR family response regulator